MEEEKALIDYLRQIRRGRSSTFDSVPEELQWEPPFADISSEEGEYLEPDPAIIPSAGMEPVHFFAFLDGVQRTQIYDERIILPVGARVPIHVAHIAAGVILREGKSLRFDHDLFEDRLLLVLPYEGIEEAGETLPVPPIPSSKSDEKLECLKNHKAFWCDTTDPGLTTPHPGESSFRGKKLLDIAKIRGRAQTRVGVWRQVLELLVLKRFIEKYPEKWILVDGPLYYDLRWASCLEFDVAKASNAVGYIKSIRERPKDLSAILKLSEKERSRVRPWPRARVPKMGRSDEEGEISFPRRHLKWYIRQRVPPRGWTPPDSLGLVAIDIDIGTLGLSSSDDPSLKPESFVHFHQPVVDSITLGIWRERYPGPSFPRDFSYYMRLYPVEKLEQALHSRLLPPRMLATLGIQRG